MTLTREKHMAWAKQRALEYCARGDLDGAFNSFVSDLSKHQKTQDHPAILLLSMLYADGYLDSSLEMAKFIQGFN